MKPLEVEKRLLAAARACPPDDRVPVAFEQRIMAWLRSGRAHDPWASWAASLWRAAAPCLGLMVLCGAAMLVVDLSNPAESHDDDLETAVYAAVDTPAESW
jgi:hypothetical protein